MRVQDSTDLVDVTLGYASAAFGTSGAIFHLWTGAGGLLVIGLNVVLAIGGIYLLWLKAKVQRRLIEDSDDERADRKAHRAERDKP